MKKSLIAAAALVALPVMAQAQTLQYPGFYAGVEGGGNYMFQTNIPTPFGQSTIYPNIGYSAGGMVGYDFVGPRVELEGRYDYNTATVSGASQAFGMTQGQHHASMANLLYDFNAGGTIVPYIGAGAGIGVRQDLGAQPGRQHDDLRLPGHPRCRLQHRLAVPREPRWPLLRHDHPDPRRSGLPRTTTSSRC